MLEIDTIFGVVHVLLVFIERFNFGGADRPATIATAKEREKKENKITNKYYVNECEYEI